MCVTVVSVWRRAVRKHGRMHVSRCCSAESVHSVVFSDDHVSSLKGISVFLYLPGFAGKRHVQFYQAALLTHTTHAVLVSFLLFLNHLQHFFVSLQRSFCLSGLCVSVNNVPTVCNVVFHAIHFASLLYCGKERLFSERNIPPSWVMLPPRTVLVHVTQIWWCYKGFGEGWRSRNFFTPLDEIM